MRLGAGGLTDQKCIFQVHNLCYSMHLRYSEYIGRLSEKNLQCLGEHFQGVGGHTYPLCVKQHHNSAAVKV